MKNIEIKVKIDDRAGMLRLIKKLGAEKQGVLRQADTYFDVPKGRLKIREEKSQGGAEVIFYNRPDQITSRFCEYEILRVDKAEAKFMKSFFEKALSILVVVKKERTLFMYHHTRIHLDRVAQLGEYLELETVIDKQPLTEGKKEHAFVIEALGLDACEKVPVSYSDLLLRCKK